jgi:Leucine-rich repeat (LRR) protein
MDRTTTQTLSAADFLSSSERVLNEYRSRGDGAAFSALCRRLQQDHPLMFEALCLPDLNPLDRSRWMALPELAFRPSFRWGGLSLRIRSDAAILTLLNDVGPDGLRLRSLRVEGADVSVVVALVEQGLCDGLRELVLEGCGLTAKGSAFPVNAQVLQIEMEGNAALFETLRGLEALRVLRLPENRLGNKGVSLLRDFVQLEGLELRGNAISDPGLKALATLTQLQRLGLSGNRIEGPGLSLLSPLSKLLKLNLKRNPIVDSETVQDLRKNLPLCDVVFES